MGQHAASRASATTCIENDPRNQFHQIQTLQHALAHFALQYRGLIVGLCRTLEGAAHQALIDSFSCDMYRKFFSHLETVLCCSAFAADATKKAHAPRPELIQAQR